MEQNGRKHVPARLSQQTFDDAVEENMQELDMSFEEAVLDALAQFRAMGMRQDELAHLVLDNSHRSAGVGGDEVQNPVLAALTRVKALSEDHPASWWEKRGRMAADLDLVREQAENDAAVVAIAGAHGAVEAALSVISKLNSSHNTKAESRTLLAAALRLLARLLVTKSNHTVLEEYACSMQILKAACENADALREMELGSEALLAALECLCGAQKYSEQNRVLLAQDDYLSFLVDMAMRAVGEACVFVAVARVLCECVSGDDVRCEAPEAFQRAGVLAGRKIVLESGVRPLTCGGVDALDVASAALIQHAADDDVFLVACQLMQALAVCDETCKRLVEMRALQEIWNRFGYGTQALDHQSVAICAQVLGLARNLGGSDVAKDRMLEPMQSPGSTATWFQCLVELAQPFISFDARIQEAFCGVVSVLALRSGERAQAIADQGGLALVCRVLCLERDLPLPAAVATSACSAIRNLGARDENVRRVLLEQPLVEQKLRTLLLHSDARSTRETAYAALRDMGLLKDSELRRTPGYTVCF
ncbi:Armadillo repeat-containing protein 6 [Porphyridium purpureum]|uniref:Armadillo repeat-containing protein 6 n=1 Tax=Porphyridium purpureum TaxID=35688 RepID=A0A5J4YRW5_PORPP|nr:Armadillo repeat-containing protein 6 [Porphyridium purpureum]|eukprot:POR2207..scf236_6